MNKKRNTGHLCLVRHVKTAEGTGVVLVEDTPGFSSMREAEKYVKDNISVGDNLSIIRVVKTFQATEKVSKVVTGFSPEDNEQLSLWD